MKHKHIEALLIAIICIVFIVFCVLMATPVGAYDGGDVVATYICRGIPGVS